jgi:hypothetical protein
MAKYTITLDKLLGRTDRRKVLQAIGMIRGVEDIDGVPLSEESPTKSPNSDYAAALRVLNTIRLTDSCTTGNGHKNSLDFLEEFCKGHL